MSMQSNQNSLEESTRNRRVAIHTSALGPIASGGIRCIVYFLNIAKEKGYDVCSFVDQPPYNSTWLKSNFPVYSSHSKEYESFDGIFGTFLFVNPLFAPPWSATPPTRRVEKSGKSAPLLNVQWGRILTWCESGCGYGQE